LKKKKYKDFGKL